jgi:glutamate synthase (ferredoxin)
VVEGVGDHGCEYMTGGRVVVLGPTGRNFAAGMSGGIAYVLDERGDFIVQCNRAMVEVTAIDDASEIELVKNMIFRHAEYTDSRLATEILLSWDEMISRFVRVLPHDYKRVLEGGKGTANFALPIAELRVKSADVSG